MKRIKIIKKENQNSERIQSSEANTANSKTGEQKRRAIETVESWVTDWRRQKNAENRRAFNQRT